MEKLTKNISKILILLENLPISDKYCMKIAKKLDMDYNYVNRQLLRLEAKGWIIGNHIRTQRFYNLTANAPIDKAKTTLIN